MNSVTRRSARRFSRIQNDIISTLYYAARRTIANPAALGLLLIALLYLLAVLFNDSRTLLAYLSAYINREAKNNPNRLTAVFIRAVGWFIGVIVDHESKICVAAASFIPWALKRETSHLLMASTLTFVACALPSVSVHIFLSAALAFWAYTQFEGAGNKMFALLVCALLVFINIEIEVLDAVYDAHYDSPKSTTTPATPKSGSTTPRSGMSG